MHFMLADHLQAKLNLSERELRFFEEQDILHPVRKNGHVFYSSRDLYRLKAILYFIRTQHLTLEMARERADSPVAFASELSGRGRN
jgi:DNA-binding transcriptional MerR regulator